VGKSRPGNLEFFSALPLVEPTTDPPPGGGNDQLGVIFPTTLTLTIDFPDTLGPVVNIGLFLYPGGSTLPISGAPQIILNGDVDLGVVVPGTRETYEIPVRLPGAAILPQTFTLVLAVLSRRRIDTYSDTGGGSQRDL
jgi:hypothetical protein